MYYLTMGAIFRMENSWLDEWIQYHVSVGVEHFILYNDDDDTRVSDRILQPYVEQGLVENIHLNDRADTIRRDIRWSQHDAYRDMIGNAINRTHWLAILDLDELLLPRQQDDVRETLQEYEQHNGLAVNWALYGSSGLITRPPNQIGYFLHRSETNWEPNQFVKSIVKPDRVLLNEPHQIHYFPTRDGNTVNENHEPVTWMRHRISTEKIRINHYCVRSWQDFWEVKASRRPFNNIPPYDANHFEHHDRNEVFDDEIYRRFGHIIQK
jgi:hypothetical protein